MKSWLYFPFFLIELIEMTPYTPYKIRFVYISQLFYVMPFRFFFFFFYLFFLYLFTNGQTGIKQCIQPSHIYKFKSRCQCLFCVCYTASLTFTIRTSHGPNNKQQEQHQFTWKEMRYEKYKNSLCMAKKQEIWHDSLVHLL